MRLFAAVLDAADVSQKHRAIVGHANHHAAPRHRRR
jgi:hypothetical protein